MKLAVITSGFLPVPASKGGAVETLLMNLLIENERKADLEFNIFSIYDEKAIEDSKKYRKVNFIFIKPPKIVEKIDKIVFLIAKNILKKSNSQSYRFIFQRLYFLNIISKNLKKNDYDKVLLENHPTQYLALKWRKNYQKYQDRYYYHCHNEFVGTYGCEHIIKNTKKMICVSNFIMNSLEKKLGIDKTKCMILRNGIDKEKFLIEVNETEKRKVKEKYNIGNEDKVLLFTGRIVPEKGIKELLEALAKVKNKKYKLLIIGAALNSIDVKTNYETEIEELVKKLDKNVIFTGFVEYKEIYKFYAIADIAVLPSIWDDPAPLTIIEAMTVGLPIITTNSGGIPEYVNKKCALIIKRDNNLVHNLGEAIENLIGNEELRKNMLEESKIASKNLTKEEYYKKFVKELLKNEK